MIKQISLTVSLPGVDVPDGAVLCLANAEFTGCAPLLPAPVASVHPALLLQSAATYIATFSGVPEGTYVLTIPPIGSFAGYQGSITIDRGMPTVIAIEVPVPPGMPPIPGVPEAPNDPGAPRLPAEPELAGRLPTTRIANGSIPANGVIAGSRAAPLTPGDGTSGAGNLGDPAGPARAAEQAAGVTALPAAGTGRTSAPGVIPLSTLVGLSILILLWAFRAGRRGRG